VRRITRGDAARVYREGYWEPAHCGALPAGVDLIVFDLAVNSGVRRAKRMLQQALGVAVDGVIGPGTRRALARTTGCSWSRGCISSARTTTARWGRFGVFGRGWLRRLNAVYARAAIWAAQP
jgi:lysozyme family protein